MVGGGVMSVMKMANKSALLLPLLVFGSALVITVNSYEDERGRRRWERGEEGQRGNLLALRNHFSPPMGQ